MLGQRAAQDKKSERDERKQSKGAGLGGKIVAESASSGEGFCRHQPAGAVSQTEETKTVLWGVTVAAKWFVTYFRHWETRVAEKWGLKT